MLAGEAFELDVEVCEPPQLHDLVGIGPLETDITSPLELEQPPSHPELQPESQPVLHPQPAL
jgi:hypothetical protein